MFKRAHHQHLADLAMMIHHWGAIPEPAWAKEQHAYGAAIRRYFDRAHALLTTHPDYLRDCLDALQMEPELAATILAALDRTSLPD